MSKQASNRRGPRLAPFALAAAMGALSAPTTAVAATDTPEAAFDRYRAKINLHDFERLAEDVIAPDAQFFFSGEEHRGIDEARAAFNRTWSIIPDEVYEMDDAEWLVRGADNALVSFRYRYRGTLKTGKPVTGGGRGTNLYALTAQGWRLVYEHLSHDPVAKAAQ